MFPGQGRREKSQFHFFQKLLLPLLEAEKHHILEKRYRNNLIYDPNSGIMWPEQELGTLSLSPSGVFPLFGGF